jgi:hypothetical protein
MRFPVLASRTLLIVTCVALALASNGRPVSASVCHDGNWDDGEFCGRDAYLVTGDTEMNHDCHVNILDLHLFASEWALTGPNLSADINGDQMVSMLDLAPFVTSFGNSVSPCNPDAWPPDACEGTIALSFSSDPNTIVSTQTQAPGTGTVYLVVDGWTDPWTIEYAVETSSNVTILDHPPTSYPYFWLAGIPISCNPDSQHSWAGFVKTSGGVWPAGPIIYNHLDYEVLDSNPAWIKLVPVPACYGNSRIRWAKSPANRSFDFKTVKNVGINGPAPPGESTCIHPQLPVSGPHMMWLLAATLLALAVIFLRHRSVTSRRPAP